MWNLTDNDLDRISRDAADRFEPDDGGPTWEQLSHRLDKEMPRPSTPLRRLPGTGPLGLISAVALVTALSYIHWRTTGAQPAKVLAIHQENSSQASTVSPAGNLPGSGSVASSSSNSNENSLHELNSTLPSPSTPASTSTPSIAPEKAPGPSAESKVQNQTPEKQIVPYGPVLPPASLEKPESTPAPVAPILNASSTAKGKHAASIAGAGAAAAYASSALISGTKTNRTSRGSGKVAVQKAGSDPASAAQSEVGTTPPQTNFSNPSALGSSAPPVDNPSSGSGVQSGVPGKNQVDASVVYQPTLPELAALASGPGNVELPNDSALNHALAQLKADQQAAERAEHKSMHVSRPLTFGLLYAADITSVNGVAPDRFGSNWGITVNYALLNRLSIGSGVILAKKYYSAHADDIRITPLGGTSAVAPPYFELEFMKGNCYMLEIPLSLRYDLARSEKAAVFARAGVSSFLMKQENYTYYGHYFNYGRPVSLALDKSYDTKSNYLFSELTLSLGTEFQVTQSLSIQVEPYVKVPLRGMGYWQLPLSSYGLSFTLGFSPALRRSRY